MQLPILGLTALVFALASPARAQVATPPRLSPVEPAEERAARVKAMVANSITSYRLSAGTDGGAALKALPVLRWRNETRGAQETEGTFVLWLRDGRPAACASLYPWEGLLVHEFTSLSPGGQLTARSEGVVVWAPETAGIAIQDVPGAPAPAATAAARLRQMKDLAEGFKVTMTGWKPDRSDRQELRLLAKPLYRYDLGGAPTPAVLDGAVFGYVQGTDPEAILLLEAFPGTGGGRWRYAFARATSAGLEAKRGPAAAWSVPFLEGEPSASKPQMTIRRRLDE